MFFFDNRKSWFKIVLWHEPEHNTLCLLVVELCVKEFIRGSFANVPTYFCHHKIGYDSQTNTKVILYWFCWYLLRNGILRTVGIRAPQYKIHAIESRCNVWNDILYISRNGMHCSIHSYPNQNSFMKCTFCSRMVLLCRGCIHASYVPTYNQNI